MYFSIIVPLYNKERYVAETIDSVLCQTLSAFELIVINDGSTDNGLSIVRSFKDERMTVISKENEGVSIARNTGIKISRGNYIAFIDADDIWDENFLSIMRELIIDFPLASFFACQFGIMFKKDITVANGCHRKRGYIDNYFKEASKAPLVWSSSTVVKKDCFNEVGFFNRQFARGEDIDMWTRLARKYKMAFEPRMLSYYVQDDVHRACLKIHPINMYFFVSNFKNMARYERMYMLRLGEALILEASLSHNWKRFLLLIRKYGYSSIIICIKLTTKGILNAIYNSGHEVNKEVIEKQQLSGDNKAFFHD